MTARFPVEFSMTPGGCFIGAVMLLILPAKLILAAILAAAIHESAHLLALLAFKVPILQIKVSVGGAVIRTSPVPPLQELLAALAGPAGSLLCLLFARVFPLLAFCGSIQGIYNLLPLYPLDGGRIFRCAAQLCFPRHWQLLSSAAGLCSIALVTSVCIFLFLRTLDTFFLLFVAYFLFGTLHQRKIPCKEGSHWVQYS